MDHTNYSQAVLCVSSGWVGLWHRYSLSKRVVIDSLVFCSSSVFQQSVPHHVLEHPKLINTAHLCQTIYSSTSDLHISSSLLGLCKRKPELVD